MVFDNSMLGAAGADVAPACVAVAYALLAA